MAQVWSLLDPPTPEEEQAIATSLSLLLQQQTESIVYNTSACRGFVIAQHSKFNATAYSRLGGKITGLHPVVHQFGHWFATSMGAATGQWVSKEDFFDTYPNNIMDMYDPDAMSSSWVPDNVADNYWANGVVIARAWDPYNFFYPSFPTIYADETSVLREIPNVFAAIECVKIIYRAWSDFTPTSKLTDQELVKEAGDYDIAAAKSVWGDKYTVVPDVKISASDAQSGRSWTNNITIQMKTGRDIAHATVIAARMSSLKTTG